MDKIVEVDFLDNTIREITKEIAHKDGIMHRAFSVILYSGNSILIQQRALDKYHCGGLWTNTCCSHPHWNENINDAAKRRLSEEMGIEAEIEELFSFTYYYKFENGLTEFEYDHVLVGEFDGKFEINKQEAADAKWIDIKELQDWMKNKPYEFTPWFIIIMPRIISYLKKLKDVLNPNE
ncbi:MAG: isopentenyl-diphosphate Delta-isomerase [Sedimentibacter sp.]|uniref:isopentenyl-diphosphate Delta-isomerase n=1 Tax=Sedimentibacter sp. TaxID=1960295 RepID=UPI0029818A91|nr:isopentenyl-diphosphate Delta-isomerase [Sedimentibacter sp.]MDW5299841.1 isopentenyl-diphosphate Delta-isomerase [Sedimentibacter sp.]